MIRRETKSVLVQQRYRYGSDHRTMRSDWRVATEIGGLSIPQANRLMAEMLHHVDAEVAYKRDCRRSRQDKGTRKMPSRPFTSPQAIARQCLFDLMLPFQYENEQTGIQSSLRYMIGTIGQEIMASTLQTNPWHGLVAATCVVAEYPDAVPVEIYDEVMLHDPSFDSSKSTMAVKRAKAVMISRLKKRFGNRLTLEANGSEERFVSRPPRLDEFLTLRDALLRLLPGNDHDLPAPPQISGIQKIKEGKATVMDLLSSFLNLDTVAVLARQMKVGDYLAFLTIPHLADAEEPRPEPDDGHPDGGGPDPFGFDPKLIHRLATDLKGRKERLLSDTVKIVVDGEPRAKLSNQMMTCELELEPGARFVRIVATDDEGEMTIAMRSVDSDDEHTNEPWNVMVRGLGLVSCLLSRSEDGTATGSFVLTQRHGPVSALTAKEIRERLAFHCDDGADASPLPLPNWSIRSATLMPWLQWTPRFETVDTTQPAGEERKRGRRELSVFLTMKENAGFCTRATLVTADTALHLGMQRVVTCSLEDDSVILVASASPHSQRMFDFCSDVKYGLDPFRDSVNKLTEPVTQSIILHSPSRPSSAAYTFSRKDKGIRFTIAKNQLDLFVIGSTRIMGSGCSGGDLVIRATTDQSDGGIEESCSMGFA